MCKLILVRHGETVWNKLMLFQGSTDTELSDKGALQAEMLAERISNCDIAAIYSSDLRRAKYTAQKIADRKSLKVVIDERLREFSFGELEGRKFSDIEKDWPGLTDRLFYQTDNVDIPGGESFKTFAVRIKAVIDDIVKRHFNQTVVCVSHGCSTRMVLCQALGMPLRYFWNIRQDNTAVNVIEYNEKRNLVTLVNDISHLSGEAAAVRYI